MLAALESCLAANAKVEAVVDIATRGELTLSGGQLATLDGVIQSCRRVVALHGVMLALDEMAAAHGKRRVRRL